jgi:aminoglycoside phosphotransferase (APT) family kinase protein
VTDQATDRATGDAPALADVDALAAWMDAQGLPGTGEPLEHRYISGGSQNEIYELRRDGLHCALRIPPGTAPAGRDDGIVREWRIIDALAGTDVPHTEAVAVCTDPSVLGRTFYLMGFVDGWSPMGLETGPDGTRAWPAPFDRDGEARRGLALQLVEGIALLSQVDWRARGLDDLGRPDGFHERQVDRWTAFLERIEGRELPGFDEAAAWLRARRPIDYVPGLMHGDYQFANVMFAHGAPARLAAIVDWEMGTVGDPKLDLGWVVHSWPQDPGPLGDGDDDGRGTVGGYVDLRGMPTRDELLAHYAAVSGRQVDDIDYYCVLARWKLAIVLEQGYQRAGDDPKLQAFGPIVLELMAGAAELAATTTYGR